MADGTLKQNTGEGKENDIVPPGIKTSHIPVSHAVFPSSANHAGTDEARSDALSSVKEGADQDAPLLRGFYGLQRTVPAGLLPRQ